MEKLVNEIKEKYDAFVKVPCFGIRVNSSDADFLVSENMFFELDAENYIEYIWHTEEKPCKSAFPQY